MKMLHVNTSIYWRGWNKPFCEPIKRKITSCKRVDPITLSVCLSAHGWFWHPGIVSSEYKMAAAAKSNWYATETNVLISILKEENIIERLDGRKFWNSDLFKTVHDKLKEVGVDCTVEQIRNRWKTLKSAYYKAKLHNNRSGVDPTNFPFYDQMDEVMCGWPLSNVGENGVDVGFQEAPDVETSDEANVSVSLNVTTWPLY